MTTIGYKNYYHSLNGLASGKPSGFAWPETSSSPASAFYSFNVEEKTLPQMEPANDWLNGMFSDTQIAATDFNGGNSTYGKDSRHEPTPAFTIAKLDQPYFDSTSYFYDFSCDAAMNLQKRAPNDEQTTRPSTPQVISTTTTIVGSNEFQATLDALSASKNGQQNRANHIRTCDNSITPGPAIRPLDTKADGGIYTCTYHGCTLRFETPSLLQKHKREGHRQRAGTTLKLNNQAGPHRCDRINPSTGKPCNSIFSRPYDLTRHEDTVHNSKKQKVHCNLCTEDKTFSRADALARHWRVCHPRVELPGKHRRRGGA